MSTVAIVQARMGSTRLPGKILAEAAGKPLLQHMGERLKRCESLDEIVVACPDVDSVALGDACFQAGIGIFPVTGDENDVLARVLHVAKERYADVIVELTADCPLIDPAIVDLTVREFNRWKNDISLPILDFVTTTRDAMSHSLAYPRGMDVRVFPTKVLAKVDKLTQDLRDREHVSLYIWEHPDQFAIRHVYAPEDLRDDVRLTVDIPEDLELVRTIFEEFLPHRSDFGLRDILELLEYRPELRKINAHVEQKAVR